MALGTAIYGFLAVWISFQLARKYVPEKWAFLATMGIWFASSLPVYMYFNPSWSHAHSAFTVALFLWYWDRTREGRTWVQWIILGLISGLMMDVYYVNAVLLMVPLLESLILYWNGVKSISDCVCLAGFLQNVLFTLIIFIAFLPTLIAKRIIYGSYWNFGYTEPWNFLSPAFAESLFSSEHGLFSWTPIIASPLIGLFFLRSRTNDESLCPRGLCVLHLRYWLLRRLGWYFFVREPFLCFAYAVFYPWTRRLLRMDGVSLQERPAASWRRSITALLIVWNLGLIFQWGTHLIPARGPISWRDAAYNQYAVVPEQISLTFKSYLTRRKQLMNRIEQKDVEHLQNENK